VKMSFDGHVSGDVMRGSVEVQGGAMAGRYDWAALRDAASTDSTPPRP
jgi:hypothetical protein